MSHPLLRTLISEMVESYLEEETALKAAKNLQKHFGSSGDIKSQKRRSTFDGRSIYSQQHNFTLNAHHDDIKKHLVQNGWKHDDFMDLYDHPTEGNKHRIKVTKGNTRNTSNVTVAKSGRFPGDTPKTPHN